MKVVVKKKDSAQKLVIQTEFIKLESAMKLANIVPSGGSAKLETYKYVPALINDLDIADKLEAAAIKVLGPENVFPKKEALGGGRKQHSQPRVLWRASLEHKGRISHQRPLWIGNDDLAAGRGDLARLYRRCLRSQGTHLPP